MASKGSLKFSRDYGIITVNTLILGKNALKKLVMAVDTAAYLTLITPTAARLLRYSEADSTGKMKISSPIGEEHGYRIKVKRLEACNRSQDDFEVGVIPIHNAYGIDGLLGLNFLEKYELNISFKNSTISLR